ncbi:protein of unknown function [Taphrina deformans PYCC 5710]|uniref:FAD-binding domain-containing protein n=1 Tax=Taphrina deformans (strain PYCC 5710 / ATCC 11124 / CBS 356.35 / IMI 108563 / JCM 9778 / NBRC 8474) TaxID=1097556 RepID=R4XDN7_TAPDE|nr:protein of unknown function [Taphrina deformans PYCC 5710]|eukprot:CCG83727.1 protein of unknown function [Taphrina deformans PYCC 5710]
MPQLRVLVVGASVAGPMTAYWFAKAGARVTVIERFPTLRTAGQAIDIRTTGVTVMRKIPGMEAAVRAKTTTVSSISFVYTDGSKVGTVKSTGDPNQQSLVSEYEIFRGDLSKILYDLTMDDEDVRFIFNEQISSIQQGDHVEDGPVTVEFKNGHPTEDYDLVVACDGATSRTRAMGLGVGVRDHMHPTNCWAAYYSVPDDLLHGTKEGIAHSAVGGKFMAIGPDPAGVTRVTLMSLAPIGDKQVPVAFQEASGKGDGTLKSLVARRFRGSGWISDTLVSGLEGCTDFYASEVCQVKVPRLSRGRFVLVGDAGYAPGFTGTGTTLAMTGAYLLAGEVACLSPDDIRAGLEGYEARMRPLVDEMSKVPPFVPSVMAPQTAWGIWLRNLIFALVTRSGILEFGQKYLAGAFAKTEDSALPEYPWSR